MSKERTREDETTEEAAEAEEEERPTVVPSDEPPGSRLALSSRPSPLPSAPKPPTADLDASRRKTPLGLAAQPAAGPFYRRTPVGLEPVRAPIPTLTDPEELEEARRRSMGVMPGQRRGMPVGALSLANVHAPNIPPPYKKKEPLASLSSLDDDWEDRETAPPPPEQQAMIDASSRFDAPPPSSRASFDLDPAPITRRAEPAEASPPLSGPPASARNPAPITEREMNDRVAVGDYSGALLIAQQLLEREPGNRSAGACAEECRAVLNKMYRARLGALDRVPVVMVARDQLRWLSIDHRAGFVLSLVDGVSSLEMILDVTGMPELDALRILAELFQQRIISFR